MGTMPSTSTPRYLDRPDQWAQVAAVARRKRWVAIDTEYLIDEKRSPAFHSQLHVWSIGWEGNGEPNGRGVIPAVAYVLPAAALDSPEIRAYLQDPTCEKWAHNAGVDRHAMDNRGVGVMGVRDSLGLFRWLLPGRVAPGPGFSLDALGVDILGDGRGKTESFVELVSRPRVVRGVRKVRERVCTCATPGCRLRSKGHSRTEVVTEVATERVSGTERFPLSDIVPGHERWDRLVIYAGQDVIVGCELVQWGLQRLAAQGNRKVPY